MSQNALSKDRHFFLFNAVLSTAALLFLGWLLLFRQGQDAEIDLRFMPAVNAGFNTLATLLLCSGYLAIRRGNRTLHQYMMVSAFAASALFLAGYIAYHYFHGDTVYPGTGWDRTLYLILLASHIILSTLVLPLALTSFFYAWRQRFDTHRKVARITLPIWIYVSVTGVLIYFILHSGNNSGP